MKKGNRIHIELYQNEFGKEDAKNGTTISATFENERLTICHYSWGSETEDHYGDFDIEYFLNFDVENTLKFKQILGKIKDEPFMNRIAKIFSDSDAYQNIKTFCLNNQIEFKTGIY